MDKSITINGVKYVPADSVKSAKAPTSALNPLEKIVQQALTEMRRYTGTTGTEAEIMRASLLSVLVPAATLLLEAREVLDADVRYHLEGCSCPPCRTLSSIDTFISSLPQ